MGHNRDQWNGEAVVIAFYPWEADLLVRGLARLADVAASPPEQSEESPPPEAAIAVAEKLDLVLELQGYGGIAGLREFLAERRGNRDRADDLLV